MTPQSAREPRPVHPHLVHFDGGVLDLPTRQPAEERDRQQRKKAASKDSTNRDTGFNDRLEAYLHRVKERNRDEKRQKEVDQCRNAEKLRKEKGFNLNFNCNNRKTRLIGGFDELPMVAAHLRRESLAFSPIFTRNDDVAVHGQHACAYHDYDNLWDEEQNPIWALVDRARNSSHAEVKQNSEVAAFKVGDTVEVRDKDMPGWRLGIVTTAESEKLKVTLCGWDQAFEWDFVRWPDSKPGGMQMGVGKTLPANSTQLPTMPSALDDGLPRSPSAGGNSRTTRFMSAHCGGSGDSTQISAQPPAIVVGAKSNQSRRCISARRASADIGGRSIGSQSDRKIECHDCSGSHAFRGCPHTRLSHEGIAGRSAGSPCASAQGEPKIGRWQEQTVKIQGSNGDMILLRPSGERYDVPAPREVKDAGTSMPLSSHNSSRRPSADLSSILSTQSWMLSDPRNIHCDAMPSLPPLGAGVEAAVESCGEGNSAVSSHLPQISSQEDLNELANILHRANMDGSETSPRGFRDTYEFLVEALQTERIEDSPSSIEGRSVASIGLTYQVLLEALDGQETHEKANKPISGRDDRGSRPSSPEAEDLVTRIRRLPSAWRHAFLKLLTEAEALPQAPQVPEVSRQP